MMNDNTETEIRVEHCDVEASSQGLFFGRSDLRIHEHLAQTEHG